MINNLLDRLRGAKYLSETLETDSLPHSTKCRVTILTTYCIILLVMKLLGDKIKEIRKRKNISQQELADKLFVSDKTISSWEKNRTEPNLDMIVKICDILDISVSHLIYDNIDKNNIETEIKIKLEEDEYNRLKHFFEHNAEFKKENNQLDIYYQPTYRKFIPENINETVDEWLRIGKRGNKIILNYKNWHKNKYCDEYEVEIDDYENLDKIFKILGIEQIAVVDKTRFTYFYLNKYEIALDYVKELGYFIEIEIKKYDKSFLEEYDDLLNMSKNLNLNLSNIDNRGYPYHIITKK